MYYQNGKDIHYDHVLLQKWKINSGIFLKCFTEFRDKNMCHYSKRVRTCHLLCKRSRCYHSTSETGSLNWIQSMFSDLSDSLNSLNSMKVLHYLGKTPVNFKFHPQENEKDWIFFDKQLRKLSTLPTVTWPFGTKRSCWKLQNEIQSEYQRWTVNIN